MKNWLLIVCSFLVMNQLATAQAPKFTETSDPAAKKVLDKIRDKYKAYEAISADFVLVIENGTNKEEQVGKIAQKGKMYRALLGNNEVISDGKTVWMYNKKQNEVQVNDYDPDNTEMLSPEKLLKFYESDKDYIYVIVGDDAASTSIEFKPTDKNADFFKIRLAINKTTNEISNIKVFAKDGGRYTLTIKKIGAGTFSDSHFGFDKTKFPGVIVTDLR